MAFSMKLPAKKPLRASAASTSNTTKQYGLILPTKKDAKKELAPASVFAVAAAEDDSRYDVANGKAAERRRVGAEAARSLQRAQVEHVHNKALAEDASVFDYDGVYDEIQSSRDAKKRERHAQRESEKQSSKYISTLLEKAKVREIEHDRIRERQLLKERAADDALYGDKEKLVSASYKRKLQEMKRWDEVDQQLDAIEAAEDVTKRGGDAMAGFYSNLLTKNLAMGGAAANARSAYTVGLEDTKDTKAEPRERHNEASEKRHDEDELVENDRPRDEEPVVKKPRAEDNRQSGTEACSTNSKNTPSELAGPTKEETISAARARYLARKAARQQQSEAAT